MLYLRREFECLCFNGLYIDILLNNLSLVLYVLDDMVIIYVWLMVINIR